MASRHVKEGELIDYELGDLTEAKLGPLEEHLLICEWCRSRLDIVHQNMAAMRQALKELQEEEPGA
jgi:hypothetical protein